MHHRKRILSLILLLQLIAVTGVFAQSATVGSTILRVGVASGSFDAASLPEDPLAAMRNLGYRLPPGGNDTAVDYGTVSLILVEFFDIPHGILYGIFGAPHYAIKELQSRGIVPATVHSGKGIDEKSIETLISSIAKALAEGKLR